VTASIEANFTRWLAAECSTLAGGNQIGEGSCFVFEDFPYQSYSFSIASGECDVSGEVPYLFLSSSPDCGDSDLGIYALTTDGDCLGQNPSIGSAQSVIVQCRESD
jgi:hypothetical protein